jgi:SAM-dependent MidA family methyltransferase
VLVKEWRVMMLDRYPRIRGFQPLVPGVESKWISSLDEPKPFHGVVIANELLDALPFHRVIFSGGSWKERYVVVCDEAGPGHDEPGRAQQPQNGASLGWEIGPLSSRSLADGLPRRAAEGTVMEVCPAVGPLMKGLSSVLAEGMVLFFDYGDTRENLLTGHPEGTLETFHQHVAGMDPFADIGSRDITAWVDFTRVIDAAKRSGFSVEGFLPQAEAFYRWGIQDLVRGMEFPSEVERVRAQLAMKTLLFSYANHRVLSLRRTRRARAAPLSSRTR